MMKIQQLSMDRIMNIDWFSHLGEPTLNPVYLMANSFVEAESYLGSSEWENVTLEESNKITGYLSAKENIIFQEWNKLIKEAKNFFQKDVLKKIPNLNDFDNILLYQCIEWDVTHYLVENAYKEKLKRPLFFEELISIYESGHLPCGWAGQWPNGKLIIY